MTSEFSTFFSWSYGLAAAGYVLFALYLLRLDPSWRKGPRARAMLLAMLLTAAWGACGLAFGITGKPLFLSAAAGLDLFRFGGWYVFFLMLIGAPGPGQSAFRVLGLRVVAAAIFLSGLLVQGQLLGIFDLPGVKGSTALLHSLTMVIFAVVLLEQLFKNLVSDSLWNVKPLCLGLFAAFAFDVYLFSSALMLHRVDSDALAVRGGIYALVLPLLVVATLRSKDWTTKVRLSQKAAFHSATLLIAGAYLLLMAVSGYYVRYFGGTWGGGLQIVVSFFAILVFGILAVSGSMRAKLKVLVGKHFFSYRYDYREEWLRFTQTLSAQNSPLAMGGQIIRGLAEMLESPAGSLWVRDADQRAMTQFARWNAPAVSDPEPVDGPLCSFLSRNAWVINLEELRSSPSRYGGLVLPEWLHNLPRAWLIVPLMVGDDMIGFVILDGARTPVDVNWEVNDLLRTAGRQAASFLAQMLATEALLEARKFESFNRMSAFVVHDLKNIVTQLSLMLRNAERHRDNPEFQKDMEMTVEHAVERMRQLMLQLREGEKPPGASVGVDLSSLIERIRKAKASQGRDVEVVVNDRIVARGHEERIERVVGHLVQNALEATGPDGRVWVSLKREGGQANLEVGDTGQGMSEDFIRDRLFKPFHTTKQTGMGIGAYESFQYVQELGGKISVQSRIGAGTRITVMLPLFEIAAGSDFKERAAAT